MPFIGQIVDIRFILQFLSKYPMPLIGQIIYINTPIPLIFQIIYVCLSPTSLEQLCDAIDLPYR